MNARSLAPRRSRVPGLGATLALATLAGVAACGGAGESDRKTQSTLDPGVPAADGQPPSVIGAPSAPAADGPGPSMPPPPPRCAPPPEPAAGAEVEITIDATRGPHDRREPVAVDRRFYGMNVADWQPQDYSPSIKPAFRDLLASLRPGVLRWPAGHRSQEYNWERGGGGQGGNWTLTAAHVDDFLALAKSVGAEPLIAINVKRGTPEAAVDLLRYMNVEGGHRVKWLQIGNEPDLTDAMTAGPSMYVDQLRRFVDALRAVDPDVKIVGPELLTGAHVGGVNGTVDWMGPILAGAGGRIDGISWHYYPLDSAQANPSSSAIMSVPHLFQESAPDWPPAALAFADYVMPALATLRDRHAPGGEVWVTELAEDPGPAAGEGISETLAGALWQGDVLGRYGEYGPGGVLRWIFKASAMHKYAIVDGGDVPRPAFGTYWLYARHFGERFVATKSSALTTVAAHAALRADGALTLVLVNKTTETKRFAARVSGFSACSGESLTLTGDGYGATSFQINGQVLDVAAATAGIAGAPLDGAHLFDAELPPTSVRVVVWRP